MTGEIYALLSAVCYGLAGVTIARGRADMRGDNGVFLSVLVTAGLTSLLWLGRGQVPLAALSGQGVALGMTLFVLAGILSTVLGRHTLYRATEQVGAVRTSLLRRLTPVFAMPCAIVLLAQWPDALDLIGGALILGGVLFYTGVGGGVYLHRGDLLGIASALSYALAYVVRRMALDHVPDPALGTAVGAMAGVVFFLTVAVLRRNLGYLVVDRGRWQILTALALAAGQCLQFFALHHTSVTNVAVLGALDVLFTALFAALLFGGAEVRRPRFWVAVLTVIAGVAVLV